MMGYYSNLQVQYNTIQYFIDTPLVGLFSDNEQVTGE